MTFDTVLFLLVVMFSLVGIAACLGIWWFLS